MWEQTLDAVLYFGDTGMRFAVAEQPELGQLYRK